MNASEEENLNLPETLALENDIAPGEVETPGEAGESSDFVPFGSSSEGAEDSEKEMRENHEDLVGNISTSGSHSHSNGENGEALNSLSKSPLNGKVPNKHQLTPVAMLKEIRDRKSAADMKVKPVSFAQFDIKRAHRNHRPGKSINEDEESLAHETDGGNEAEGGGESQAEGGEESMIEGRDMENDGEMENENDGEQNGVSDGASDTASDSESDERHSDDETDDVDQHQEEGTATDNRLDAVASSSDDEKDDDDSDDEDNSDNDNDEIREVDHHVVEEGQKPKKESKADSDVEKEENEEERTNFHLTTNSSKSNSKSHPVGALSLEEVEETKKHWRALGDPTCGCPWLYDGACCKATSILGGKSKRKFGFKASITLKDDPKKEKGIYCWISGSPGQSVEKQDGKDNSMT